MINKFNIIFTKLLLISSLLIVYIFIANHKFIQKPINHFINVQYHEPQNDTFIELKILSFNVWGLPSPFGKDLVKRFTNIGKLINDFDIVALQETFSDYSENKIYEATTYSHKYRLNNNNLFVLGSGLGVLSKYPIIKKEYIQFSQCADSDCFANKGVLFVRLNIPSIGEIDFYNTHYQSSDLNEDIRIIDNYELYKLFQKNNKGNLTILAGDFNFTNYDHTDSKSKAFFDFKRYFDPIDTFREINPDDAGFTYNPINNTFGDKNEKPKRLDYIFVLPKMKNIDNIKTNYNVEIINSKIIFDHPAEGIFLSDHFGLITTLKIYINKK